MPGSRLGLIVFRRYGAGAATRFAPVSPAAAARRAVGSTFLTDRENLPLERLRPAAMCEQVPAFELVGGDLGEACDAVIDALPLGLPSAT